MRRVRAIRNVLSDKAAEATNINIARPLPPFPTISTTVPPPPVTHHLHSIKSTKLHQPGSLEHVQLLHFISDQVVSFKNIYFIF